MVVCTVQFVPNLVSLVSPLQPRCLSDEYLGVEENYQNQGDVE